MENEKMTEKRFDYYRNMQMITDNLTGFTYTGNNEICKLLNKESDRADKIVESFDEWYKVLRKYGITSPDKLDQVLWNERVW